MALVVATYFWQPDPGSKFAAAYTPDDVRRLQRMVAKHCTVPHEFVVITDRPEMFADDADIRTIPIDWATHVSGTCFARLMTFHPKGAEMIGERVLQIDLDTLIVGNMDHLVTRQEDLVLWRNPARIPWDDVAPGMPPTAAEWDGTRWLHRVNQRRTYYNTSILLHRCGTLPEIWERFDPRNPPAKDDQWYLSDLFGRECAYFDGERDGVYRLAREDTPGSGVSGELPANACIVTFPGSEGKADNPVIAAANPWIEAHLR